MPRYRFGDFVLSPRRRALTRSGIELPLIPRYFDLLVYLVERRDRAVHRRDIFDAVWTDVVVSDSALTQAIRTIRRMLGDDPREPRFLRTVSRHGYQFVFAAVAEEDEDGPWTAAAPPPATISTATATTVIDPFAPLLALLSREPDGPSDEEEQRDAAERLHALGTADALGRLGTRPGHSYARALLRDARWESPEAGPVPIVGAPDGWSIAWHVVRLRMRRAASLVAARWASAAIGAGAAGGVGGSIGGVLLVLSPGSLAPWTVVPVLATIGVLCGFVAGAGVGAGLAVAESVARSWRTSALTAGGALGGGAVGLAVQVLGRWTLAVLVGMHVDVHGALDGFLIGGACGFGYAIATGAAAGGVAAPRGAARVQTALLTALGGSLAALILASAGRPLVGGTIHAIAQAATGAQALLTPLGRLIGEPGFGRVTAALIGVGESATFGAGLALGLTHRR